MYLRFLAKYYHVENKQIQYGFFWAADYLVKHAPLSVEHRKHLEATVYWFDHNLPIPEYYQDEKNRQAAKSATSWYKETAKECVQRMNSMIPILEAHHVDVSRLTSKKLMGKVIYEDDFQVTIIPFREVAKKVK